MPHWTRARLAAEKEIRGEQQKTAETAVKYAADTGQITRGQEIIDNYKKEFNGITKYMDDTINFAREHGYVQTLMGRKRWLRDINSSNFTVRGFAERNAINAPIQGSAADMIKVAMINIHREMKEQKLDARMTMQVHDELVFDVPNHEVEKIKPIIMEHMKNAIKTEVPIMVEIGTGSNWLEAH